MRKKKLNKPYCSQCNHYEKSDYCPINPTTMSQEYLAPGQTTQHSEMCAMKNMNNNCPDFKKKK